MVLGSGPEPRHRAGGFLCGSDYFWGQKLASKTEMIVSALEKSVFLVEMIVSKTDIIASWIPIIESGPEMIVCRPSITGCIQKCAPSCRK